MDQHSQRPRKMGSTRRSLHNDRGRTTGDEKKVKMTEADQPDTLIIVKVFLAPTCRYVDDFFGCNPEDCMVTRGSCLTAMCNLLDFPTDPDKNDDKAWDLAVLGARVALDVAAMSVSAAVDANKAQRWATELRCMTGEKEVQPRPGGNACWSLGIHLHDCGRPARKSFRETLLCPSQRAIAWI